MKQFELTLVRRGNVASFDALQIEKIEGDDLVELLAQFILVIANVQRRIAIEQGHGSELSDDIPF